MPLSRPNVFKTFESKTVKLEIEYKVGTETKTRKTKIPIYGGSDSEDVEHFFEMFVSFKKVMTQVALWNDDFTQGTNVDELMGYFEECISGVAEANWRSIRKDKTSCTWKDFKTDVATYITTQIVDPEAYHEQKRYLEHTIKPRDLTMKVYWQRYQILNLYLPYLLTRDIMEQVSDGQEKEFKKLWTYGSFGGHEQKQHMLRNVPVEWKNRFNVSGMSQTRDMQTLLNYFVEQERQEKERAINRQQASRNRYPAAIRGGGRRPDLARRNRYHNSYNNQSSRGGQYQSSRGGQYQLSRGGYNNYRFMGGRFRNTQGRYQTNNAGRSSGRFSQQHRGGGGQPQRPPQQAPQGQAYYGSDEYFYPAEQDHQEFQEGDERGQDNDGYDEVHHMDARGQYEDEEEELAREFDDNLWLEHDRQYQQDPSAEYDPYYEPAEYV